TDLSVYFPLQYPIRTIVLGEDRVDNSIDLQKAFNIGVSIGGMYDNTSDRIVDFIIDPSYFTETQGKDTLYGKDMNGINSKLLLLPPQYYTMVPDDQVTVPKGSFNGLIRINLTDDFFNDPNAIKLKYILPLKITDVPEGFSLLTGKVSAPSIVSPRWYVTTDWATGYLPKDFTLFAVKFINPWHGTFFYRGVQIKDGVQDKVFHAIDISANETAKIETEGLKKATYNRMGEKLGVTYKSLLTFSDDVNGVGDITVSQAPGTTYTISGSGKYYKSSTAFGKENGWTVDPLTGQIKGALTITLNFTVLGLSGTTTYQFTDTLVCRGNDVKYEEFTIARPVL
ncbi:MAG: DUF1735 domain-containing protein, partial [Bacteroidales bacterium]|nr:DUF1735 domain-containing protein [Bacteroidales bacterium]